MKSNEIREKVLNFTFLNGSFYSLEILFELLKDKEDLAKKAGYSDLNWSLDSTPYMGDLTFIPYSRNFVLYGTRKMDETEKERRRILNK